MADKAIFTLIQQQANAHPERVAIVDGNTRVSYQRLVEQSGILASSIARYVRKGDRLVAFLSNGAPFISLLLACMRIGAVFVPLNPLLSETEARERVFAASPQLAFIEDESQLPLVSQANCPIVAVGLSHANCLSLQQLEAQPFVERCLASLSPDDPFLIIFTSGSTGNPKGVVIGQRSLTYAFATFDRTLQKRGTGTTLAPLPVCHLFGINAGILYPLSRGGSIVILKQFQADVALDLIQEQRVTTLCGVPTIFARLAHAQEAVQRDTSSLRDGLMGGAPAFATRRIFDLLGCRVSVIYGLTESPILASTEPDDTFAARDTTVGKLADGVIARIAKPETDKASSEKTGELLVKSPGIMLGYLDPHANRFIPQDPDDWFDTGDIVNIDRKGRLSILGRKIDRINRGGYKVFPAEVETAYRDNANVKSICVIGAPHPDLGEQIVAFVQLTAPKSTTPEALREFARGRIAKYKLPDKVIILDQLPTLPNGKIDKQALRIRLAESPQPIAPIGKPAAGNL